MTQKPRPSSKHIRSSIAQTLFFFSHPLSSSRRLSVLLSPVLCFRASRPFGTDFVANVSHELKTPLTVMQNYGTLLQQPNLSDEKRLEYAKAITESARRLANLITNILKLKRRNLCRKCTQKRQCIHRKTAQINENTGHSDEHPVFFVIQAVQKDGWRVHRQQKQNTR